MGPGNRVPCERSQTHDRERILWHRLENHGPSQKPSASGCPGWTETSPAAWSGALHHLSDQIAGECLRKLRQRGLPATAQAALTRIRDAVGVRVICAFQDDVYQMASIWRAAGVCPSSRSKDYISRPKENGYRSYHLILGILDGPGKGMTVEVQLRTIAIDCWASLEHQIKYKRRVPHEHLVREELKRCADEIASVDLSMETIRELLNGA